MTHNDSDDIVRSRRDFLFGRTTPSQKPIPPPWAEFLNQNCTRCGDCIDACEESILVIGENQLPSVDFTTGECVFCGDCVDVCKAGVFVDRHKQDIKPWNLAVSVSDHCFLESKVYCRSCGDACPERAIQFTQSLGAVTHLTVHHDLCTGCGACVASCPRDAVSIQEAVQN